MKKCHKVTGFPAYHLRPLRILGVKFFHHNDVIVDLLTNRKDDRIQGTLWRGTAFQTVPVQTNSAALAFDLFYHSPFVELR